MLFWLIFILFLENHYDAQVGGIFKVDKYLAKYQNATNADKVVETIGRNVGKTMQIIHKWKS